MSSRMQRFSSQFVHLATLVTIVLLVRGGICQNRVNLPSPPQLRRDVSGGSALVVKNVVYRNIGCPPGCAGCPSCEAPVTPGVGVPGSAVPGTIPPAVPGTASPTPDTSSNLNDANLGNSLGSSDLGNLGGSQTGNQNSLSSSFGGSRGSTGSTPGMIGDFFGGGLTVLSGANGQDEPATLSSAGGDRIYKISENTSPFPTDRFFFNYHHFNRAVTTADAQLISLDRYVFGAEKTFMGGTTSFEIRVPFANGLNTDQAIVNQDFNQDTQFGNISLAVKALLWERNAVAIAAGLGFSLPTAEDAKLFVNSNGDGFNGNRFQTTRQFGNDPNLIATIENDSFHLQPFLGIQIAPSQRMWITLFTQLDLDVNGNVVVFDGFEPGRIQEQNLLFLDASFGYWLFRDPSGRSLISGIAPMVEFHYSTTVSDADVFQPSEGELVTNPGNRVDLLNVTGGIRIQMGSSAFLTISGVAPLREFEDRTFDSEFAVQFTRIR